MTKCPICYEQDNFTYIGKGKVLKSISKTERYEMDIYQCQFCYSKIPEDRLLKNEEYTELEKKINYFGE